MAIIPGSASSKAKATRGAIRDMDKYRQAKCLANEVFDGFLPRNITPSETAPDKVRRVSGGAGPEAPARLTDALAAGRVIGRQPWRYRRVANVKGGTGW